MKKIYTIVFLFLAFLLVVFLTSKAKTVEATHTFSCSVTSSSTAPGGPVTVSHTGLAAGETFRMYGTTAYFATDIGSNTNSSTSSKTQTFNIPSNTPTGSYKIEVDFRYHNPDKVDCGGSFTVGAASSNACTYIFGPSSSGPRDTIVVTVQSGNSSHPFLAAITTTAGAEITSAANLGAFPLSIAMSAPDNAGTYVVAVRDDSESPTLCSGPSVLTVSASGGSYVAVANTAGCTGSLSCIVATSPTTSATDYTFTGLSASTTFDIYVCSPDCGSGPAIGGFNPKICTSKTDGTLTVNWLMNFCDGDSGGIPSSGGAGCSGFLSCMSGIVSPTQEFSETGLIGKIFSSILPIIIGLGGFLTVIIIVISGIQFITSSGNPEAAAAARGRLIFALIGFALLVLAFAITQIIDNLFLRGSGIV